MNDYTWKELAQKFEDLQPSMENARLDYQWGSIPKIWSLGGCDQITRDRFYTLAKIAGLKLSVLLDKDKHEDLKNEKNFLRFWYYSLKIFSGKFQIQIATVQKDKEGNVIGPVNLGHIYDVAIVSSNMCMEFATMFQSNISHSKEESKFKNFYDKYAIPIIVTVIGGLIVGLVMSIII